MNSLNKKAVIAALHYSNTAILAERDDPAPDGPHPLLVFDTAEAALMRACEAVGQLDRTVPLIDAAVEYVASARKLYFSHSKTNREAAATLHRRHDDLMAAARDHRRKERTRGQTPRPVDAPGPGHGPRA